MTLDALNLTTWLSVQSQQQQIKNLKQRFKRIIVFYITDCSYMAAIQPTVNLVANMTNNVLRCEALYNEAPKLFVL